MSQDIIEVVAFIDWNSQLCNAKTKSLQDHDRKARQTLEWTADWIGSALMSIDSRLRYRVRPRLYYGWHSGVTPTADRRSLDRVNADPNFRVATAKGKVAFYLPIAFGDLLLCALPHRLRKRPPLLNLPDTYRLNRQTGTMGEKMVDTALASDLVAHARIAPADWRIVLVEDDDVIPPLFTAEFLSKEKGGRTLLLRRRAQPNPHIDLTGLLCERSTI